MRKWREERLRETQELRNGQVRLSAEEEPPAPERTMGLDLSTWEDPSCDGMLQILSNHDGEHGSVTTHSAPPSAVVVVREKSRAVDEASQKTTRAKRESRRMRELEQAKFSLELLKVRATGSGSPSEDRRWSVELVAPTTPPLYSPQGTPDSQSSKGSFELLSIEDAPKATEEGTDSEEPCCSPSSAPTSPRPDHLHQVEIPEVAPPAGSPDPPKPAAPSDTHPPKMPNYLPTFYVPAGESGGGRSSDEPLAVTETAVAPGNAVRERRETTRRPVVVVISMQKESPLSPELSDILRPPVEVPDSAAQTGGSTPSPQKPAPAPVPVCTVGPKSDQAVIEKLVRLNEEKEERQRSQQQQNEKEMMEQIRQQKEALERQRRFFAQFERDMFEKQRGEALQRIQQSRQGAQDGGRLSVKQLRPSSLLMDRTPGLAPHSRTQSDSTPPPPAPTDRPGDGRPPAEGWAPKLTLETKDGGGTRARVGSKKTQSNTTVSLTEKTGNIFFSPKDKVTFAK